MLDRRRTAGRQPRRIYGVVLGVSCANMTFPNSNGPGGYADNDPTIDCSNIKISRAASATAVEGSGVLTVDTTAPGDGSWIYSTIPKTGTFNLRGDLDPLILDSDFMSMEVGTTLRTRVTANDTATSQIIVLIKKETGVPNQISIFVFYVNTGGGFVGLASVSVDDDGVARRVSIERTATHFVMDVKNSVTLVSDLGGPASVLISDVMNGASDSYVGAGYCDAQAAAGTNTGTIDNLVDWA